MANTGKGGGVDSETIKKIAREIAKEMAKEISIETESSEAARLLEKQVKNLSTQIKIYIDNAQKKPVEAFDELTESLSIKISQSFESALENQKEIFERLLESQQKREEQIEELKRKRAEPDIDEKKKQQYDKAIEKLEKENEKVRKKFNKQAEQNEEAFRESLRETQVKLLQDVEYGIKEVGKQKFSKLLRETKDVEISLGEFKKTLQNEFEILVKNVKLKKNLAVTEEQIEEIRENLLDSYFAELERQKEKADLDDETKRVLEDKIKRERILAGRSTYEQTYGRGSAIAKLAGRMADYTTKRFKEEDKASNLGKIFNASLAALFKGKPDQERTKFLEKMETLVVKQEEMVGNSTKRIFSIFEELYKSAPKKDTTSQETEKTETEVEQQKQESKKPKAERKVSKPEDSKKLEETPEDSKKLEETEEPEIKSEIKPEKTTEKVDVINQSADSDYLESIHQMLEEARENVPFNVTLYDISDVSVKKLSTAFSEALANILNPLIKEDLVNALERNQKALAEELEKVAKSMSKIKAGQGEGGGQGGGKSSWLDTLLKGYGIKKALEYGYGVGRSLIRGSAQIARRVGLKTIEFLENQLLKGGLAKNLEKLLKSPLTRRLGYAGLVYTAMKEGHELGKKAFEKYEKYDIPDEERKEAIREKEENLKNLEEKLGKKGVLHNDLQQIDAKIEKFNKELVRLRQDNVLNKVEMPGSENLIKKVEGAVNKLETQRQAIIDKQTKQETEQPVEPQETEQPVEPQKTEQPVEPQKTEQPVEPQKTELVVEPQEIAPPEPIKQPEIKAPEIIKPQEGEPLEKPEQPNITEQPKGKIEEEKPPVNLTLVNDNKYELKPFNQVFPNENKLEKENTGFKLQNVMNKEDYLKHYETITKKGLEVPSDKKEIEQFKEKLYKEASKGHPYSEENPIFKEQPELWEALKKNKPGFNFSQQKENGENVASLTLTSTPVNETKVLDENKATILKNKILKGYSEAAKNGIDVTKLNMDAAIKAVEGQNFEQAKSILDKDLKLVPELSKHLFSDQTEKTAVSKQQENDLNDAINELEKTVVPGIGGTDVSGIRDLVSKGNYSAAVQAIEYVSKVQGRAILPLNAETYKSITGKEMQVEKEKTAPKVEPVKEEKSKAIPTSASLVNPISDLEPLLATNNAQNDRTNSLLQSLINIMAEKEYGSSTTVSPVMISQNTSSGSSSQTQSAALQFRAQNRVTT